MVEEKHEWEETPEAEDEPTVRSRVEGAIRDVLRRTLNQGSGARAVTEEVVRAVVTDMKVPREVATYLLSNVDNIKNEITRVIANEVRRFLESANLGEELARILTSISFEVRTEVRFIPNEDAVNAVKPSVRSRVGIKSSNSEEVIHEGESNEFDRALRAGITEFIQGFFGRKAGGTADTDSPTPAGPRRDQEKKQDPPASREPSANSDGSRSMQTSAERRQQLRKALAKRRDRSDN
jgi:predicted house-cleaning noncanonical NTP pyrophosphatase (MazG superfamily)